MNTDILCGEICNTLGLGRLEQPPCSVSGGFMHKMYRLQTVQGTYAVKLLNPSVMRRDGVFENYKLAEALEKKLQTAGIPIVPSLEWNHKKMQCIANQYFYVFPWIDGKALLSQEIQHTHCEQMGRILARIHNIEQTDEAQPIQDIKIDWDFYIQLSEQRCPEISSLLKSNRELFLESQKKGNAAARLIPPATCISNGDMDNKNVLWADGKPLLIDLESLNYGNPYKEMFELALCWSGYEHCCINYDLLETFLTSYLQEYGTFHADWESLYWCNNGRLLWLEYNVKRALALECDTQEEQVLGIEQVKETVEHALYYNAVKTPLLTRLNALF